MTRAVRWAVGAIIVIIIAVIIVIAATGNNKTNNTNSGASNTSQSSNKPAVKNSIVQTKNDPTLGQYLADPTGKALYTYNGDTANTSNCTGSCLTNWPPYLATATVANLPSGITTIKRSDTGAMQYAYNGMPLYYFSGDSNGKVTGNGIDNFTLAKPASSTTSQPSNSSSGSGSSNGNPY